MLLNGRFMDQMWNVGDNSWVAIEIGKGPKRLFFCWNNPNQTWSDEIARAMSCKQGLSCPVDYTITTSSDSPNGIDGTWEETVTVIGKGTLC